MNIVFPLLILLAVVTAALQQLSGDANAMSLLSKSIIDSAAGAVELALGLVGVMALFLGLMKIAEQGGLLRVMARLVKPLMTRLFPEVPADHPAMGAMVMNISANALGLGNAATPFGIKAMQQLERLNPTPGTASNAMALFLAINTSGVTLLPTGIIALRAAAGSVDPAGIIPTTLFATFCSTSVAIVTALTLQRFFRLPAPTPAPQTGARDDPEDDQPTEEEVAGYPAWVSWLTLATIAGIAVAFVNFGAVLSDWILPLLVSAFLLYGLSHRVAVYDAFVEGAKEGFSVALRIIPYLVGILVAIGMLRASGALDALVSVLGAWTEPLGLPAEALPMALLRPLSGSGAYGIVAATLNDPAIGPDSYVGYLVSTLQGSTETTFYVLAVYFGAVGIRRLRHALITALIADLAGIVGAILACRWFLGA